jgi:hypothetical protein
VRFAGDSKGGADDRIPPGRMKLVSDWVTGGVKLMPEAERRTRGMGVSAEGRLLMEEAEDRGRIRSGSGGGSMVEVDR